MTLNSTPTLEDRLAARERPDGTPVMHQKWDKLLFLHWRVPVDVLRRLIPQPLEIDTFEGEAWFSITPLTIYDLKPPYLPALPVISRLHELNVRTYVHYDGVPGVWFFSLDANNLPAVLGARSTFSLPYFYADIDLDADGSDVRFTSVRSHSGGYLNAAWTVGEEMPAAEPGSLDFFLVERYCLYAADTDDIYRCRIAHVPWPLQCASSLNAFSSNMAETMGLPTPDDEPLLHCGGPLSVDVWYPEKAARRTRHELL